MLGGGTGWWDGVVGWGVKVGQINEVWSKNLVSVIDNGKRKRRPRSRRSRFRHRQSASGTITGVLLV